MPSPVYKTTYTVDNPARIGFIAGHYAHLLERFLTFCFGQYSAEVLPHLRNNKIDTKPKSSSDVLFHCTIYLYSKANLGRFRSFIAEALLSILSQNKASVSPNRYSWKFLSPTKINNKD